MGNVLSPYTVTEHEIKLPGTRGSIKGLEYDSKVRRYAGIPYALPPTGEYRWKKPRPIPKAYRYEDGYDIPFDGTKFGPVCPQAKFASVAEQGKSEAVYSEDCLRVNIWTPVEKPGEEGRKWPVMLWLHGGWFQMGDPSQEESMDPTELISTGGLNAVFVAIGYRLNIFGFLSSEELKEESGDGSVGNYGLWDERLAMDWVQENISAFGGDPNNVSLGGRSAGAYGVHAQVLHDFRKAPSPAPTKSLFNRFLMFSNAIPAQPRPLAETQAQFEEVCDYFQISKDLSGAEKLSALRKIDAYDLVAAIKDLKNHTFRPITDEDFILSGMIEYQRSGEFAREFKRRGMKLLIGEMLNEESLYSVYNPPEPNEESLRLQIANYYGPTTADRVLPWYKVPTNTDKKEWLSLYGSIISDGQVRAPSRFLVDSMIKHGVDIKDIWRYQIAYRMSFIDEKTAPMDWGVTHAMDRPIWNFSILHGPTPEERVLMEDWIRDLVAFVNGEKDHLYGTQRIEEFKVMTSERKIEVQTDARWSELLKLADHFSG
ncbi:Alpha/Beta hydrolase protein, partial [Cadophora sp. MPI-SDFR-AT-0126]